MTLLTPHDLPPSLCGVLVGVLGYALLVGARLRHGMLTTAAFLAVLLEPSHARAR
jgi:hypothetical protein